jgi:mannose-6-phosphate isomerase-like protein (cupin superfamily)
MEHVIHPSSGPREGSPHFEGRDHEAGLSIILVDAATGEGPRLHQHDYEEVFVVHAGTVTLRVGDAQVDAHPGEVVVVPAGTPHGFVSSGDERLRMTSIHHSPEFVTEWLE